MAELSVEISAKIDKLLSELKKAKTALGGIGVAAEKLVSKLKNVGEKMSRVGKSMTTSLTLPLVAFAAVSAKTFASFEKDLAKIEGLVGIAGNKVEKMGESALIMASKFGKSANEASEALFFITSAGLRGSDAMDVLEASLKASVIGLGDTKSIADLTTSAMNAYGVDVLSAAKATDVLTAAVREGKLDAVTLAQSMGRVLPIASAMGVSFNEVGAAFASMSRTGTKADEAATQLRGILSSLLSPSSQAETALTELGLSSDGLRKNIKDNGLLNTLELLTQKFEGNSEKAALVFGNVRALSGVLDLMGKNVNGTREIFSNMNNTLGDTDKAFKIASKTADFKFKVAINSVRNSLVKIGEIIANVFLPIIQKVSEKLLKWTKIFTDLSPATKKLIVVIGILVAAIGPLLVGFGFLMTTVLPGLIVAFAGLSSAVVFMGGVFKTLTTIMLANPFVLIAAGIAAIVLGLTTMIQKITPAVSKLKTFFNLIKSGGVYSRFVNLQMQDQVTAMIEESKAAKIAAAELKKFNKKQKDTADDAKKATNELKKAAKAAEKLANVVSTGTKSPRVLVEDRSKESKDKPDILELIDVEDDNNQQEFQSIDWVAYANVKGLEEEKLKLLAKLKEFNESANNLIAGSISQTFSNLGSSIGEALASGGNVLSAVGNTIIQGLSSFLSEMGGMLVKYGTLAILKGKLDLAILAGGPLAIGAGVAAVAVGVALSAAGAALGQKSAGGSSGDTGSSNFRGSSGGGNFGASSSGGMQNVVFEIQGTKLVGVISNTLSRNRSLGGSLSLT